MNQYEVPALIAEQIPEVKEKIIYLTAWQHPRNHEHPHGPHHKDGQAA